MADVPKMIGCGEFIINGSERVVVSQIQRSSGVDFDEVKEDSGQTAYSCRFIPERGTWIEFTISRRDVLQVRLGQSGRMPATWLLRAMLGPDSGADAEILALFYERETLPVPGGGKATLSKAAASPAKSSTRRPAKSSRAPARASAAS